MKRFRQRASSDRSRIGRLHPLNPSEHAGNFSRNGRYQTVSGSWSNLLSRFEPKIWLASWLLRAGIASHPMDPSIQTRLLGGENSPEAARPKTDGSGALEWLVQQYSDIDRRFGELLIHLFDLNED